MVRRYVRTRPRSVAMLGIVLLSLTVVSASTDVQTGLNGNEPTTAAVNPLMPPSAGGTVDSVASGAPAWLLLIVLLTASVTEELLFRAYPTEHLARLTGKRWPVALLSLAAFVALHLQGWNLGHVIGVVLPLGAIMTGLYLWRRNLIFMIITHFFLDLPIVLLALGVLPPL